MTHSFKWRVWVRWFHQIKSKQAPHPGLGMPGHFRLSECYWFRTRKNWDTAACATLPKPYLLPIWMNQRQLYPSWPIWVMNAITWTTLKPIPSLTISKRHFTKEWETNMFVSENVHPQSLMSDQWYVIYFPDQSCHSRAPIFQATASSMAHINTCAAVQLNWGTPSANPIELRATQC